MPPADATPRSPLAVLRSLEGAEIPFALLMFAYFFLVITSFWILKPLKKALFIEHYDAAGFTLPGWTATAAEAELLAKVLNMVVAFAAVALFTVLARRLHRERLTWVFTAAFAAGYALYATRGSDPGGLTVWSFYLFGDLFSTVMVATFFAFLNDSVRADRAKRLYGPIGLGGVLGGAFGSLAVSAWIDTLSLAAWLGVCAALAGGIVVAATAAGRLVARSDLAGRRGDAAAKDAGGAAPVRNAALEGAALVARSRYLLAIAALVGLYEIVSTVMDFQFTSTVAHYLDGDAIGEHVALVYAITNGVAAVIQLLGTGWVMTRYGVGAALLVLPVAAALGSAAFMLVPALWVGSALNTVDNAFNYSINQSAREALYVPRSRAEKYRAKAFIDMFVMRLAKAVAVGVSLAIGAWFDSFASVRWLGVFTLAVVAAWLVAARYAGRRFRAVEDGAP